MLVFFLYFFLNWLITVKNISDKILIDSSVLELNYCFGPT